MLPTNLNELQAKLTDAEETLSAIRSGSVDALVIASAQGDQVYTLQGTERPYRALIEQMQQGAATLSSQGIILYANQRLANLLDVPLQSLIGNSIMRFITKINSWEAFLNKSQIDPNFELTIRNNNNEEISAYISVSTLSFEEIQVICLIFTDLTAQKRNQAEFQLLYQASSTLAQIDNMEHAFIHILQYVCEMTSWVYGEVWVPNNETEAMIYAFSWYENDEALAKFEMISKDYNFKFNEGIIGQVWATRQSNWVSDVTLEQNFCRSDIAQQHGLRAAIAVPIQVNNQIVAVMVFF